MSGHYENPPLVEVIAELQWTPPSAQFLSQVVPGVPIQLPAEMAVAAERFYDAFAVKVDELGFRNSERLASIGSPTFPGQVAIRYRKSAGAPPLIQLGVGVFTMNGLPPTYTHWGDFSPMLREGLKALLEAREPEMGTEPFASLSLRYVNAFNVEFWEGVSPELFISNTLGFSVQVPESLRNRADPNLPMSAALQLRVPLANGSNLALVVAQGQSNDAPAVIVDSTVMALDIAADLDTMMERFEHAHSVASDLFDAMTNQVQDILRPIVPS